MKELPPCYTKPYLNSVINNTFGIGPKTCEVRFKMIINMLIRNMV